MINTIGRNQLSETFYSWPQNLTSSPNKKNQAWPFQADSLLAVRVRAASKRQRHRVQWREHKAGLQAQEDHLSVVGLWVSYLISSLKIKWLHPLSHRDAVRTPGDTVSIHLATANSSAHTCSQGTSSQFQLPADNCRPKVENIRTKQFLSFK